MLLINYNLLFCAQEASELLLSIKLWFKKIASNYTPAANEEVSEQQILNTGPSR